MRFEVTHEGGPGDLLISLLGVRIVFYIMV